jgi:Zn-dependent peptidase ImmA (M78 family)/DNA-binding XRE family transcriptional regulator
MDADVGARIRSLREALGLKAQDLAAQVNLDPTALSKIENGRRGLKSAELTAIASALKVSPLALLEQDSLLSSLPIAARSAGSSITEGGAYDRLLALSELHVVLSDAGIHASADLAGIPNVKGRHWLDAADALVAWAEGQISTEAVGEQRLGSLADAIEERLKIDVLIEQYPDDNLTGAAITDHAFPLLFVNSDHPRSRCLFTLAHELGHLLANHGHAIHLDRELTASSDDERLANAFAAAFLIPESTVRAAMDSHGRTIATLLILTYNLGVSFESLVFRLHNLQIIDAAGRDKLRELGWARLRSHLDNPEVAQGLPRPVVAKLQARGSRRPAGRPPAFLMRRAFAAYHKGIISIRPLADLLGEDPEQLLASAQDSREFDELLDRVEHSNLGESAWTESPDERFAGSPV